MLKRSWLFIVVLAAVACSSNAGISTAQTPAGPQAGAEAAVQQFLQAVADSNLVKMAEYWGTAKGPAAKTKQPSDYERRIVVMQAYLRNLPYRILSNTQDGTMTDQRILQVGFTREGCETVVPVTVIQVSSQWLVNSIDLEQVGAPGRKTCQSRDGTPGN